MQNDGLRHLHDDILDTLRNSYRFLPVLGIPSKVTWMTFSLVPLRVLVSTHPFRS